MSQVGQSTAFSSGRSKQDGVNEDEDLLWTRVDIDVPEGNDDHDEDKKSTVLVSRVSSPLPIWFQEIRASSPPTRVLWPSTLPWFLFQNKCFSVTNKEKLLLKAGGAWNVSKEANRALAVMVGSKGLEICANSESIEHAAAEIGKIMPESFPGEHSATVKAFACGDPLEAKFAALRLLAYQVSNNLIEDDDPADSDVDPLEEDYCPPSDKIINMFREIGLPRDVWTEIFSAEQDRTSAALAEALFEAALNCSALDVVEGLLESGVDPNQLIWTRWSGTVQRPLQLTADSRVLNLEIARLLIRAGADVDAVTEDDEIPALHSVAYRGTLEMTKLLVEKGADIRRLAPGRYVNEPIRNFTALVCVASSSSSYNEYDSNVNDSKSVHRTKAAKIKEPESLRIFRYLLSLHDNSRDHLIFQDALVMAAHHDRTDMIKLLHAAGADVNENSSCGFTALEATAWQNYKPLRTTQMLVGFGANPNRGSRLTSLHMAAAHGNAELVQLLVINNANIDASVTLPPWQDVYMLGVHFNVRVQESQIRRAMAHLHTPLHLALYRNRDAEGIYQKAKTDKAAMILLRAGAKLTGGELIQAVNFNSEVLIRTLLDRGADVNEKSWNGSTALQICLRDGHGKIASILLCSGATVKGGELFWAFKAGQRDIINVLRANGANLHELGPNGESILEAACSSQNSGLIRWVMEHGPSPYDSGALCTVVSSFVEEEEDRYITRLLRLLNQRRFGKVDRVLEATAVGIAAYKEHWPILEYLLHLQDLNTCIVPLSGYDGYKDLIQNCRSPIRDAYKEPFWHDSSMIQCSALVPAILGGNWEIVQALLQEGRYSPDPLTLLTAVNYSSLEEITELIAHGAEVNPRAQPYLDTPLQYAVRRKRVNVVKLLLTHGADVNATPAVDVPFLDSWGNELNDLPPRTALQAAVELGHLQLIDLLLDAGADVNQPLSPDTGATALQLAVAKGHLGIARQLVQLGAEIDAYRARLRGRTALEGAAEQGRLDAVQFLLENGAKTEGEGVWQYHRAIGFAKSHGHQTVARLLEEWREWQPDDHHRSKYSELLCENFQEPDEVWWLEGEYDSEYSDEEDCDEDLDDDDDNDEHHVKA
ncbi:ankyrin [Cadophora sp. DSE1049]|nr:ankyrin [Cadophora sp. DSE1049]